MVPRVRSRHDAEHQRGVGHGPRYRSDVDDVVAVGHGPVRNPAQGGLEAEDSAEVRRHAYRARAVRALVQRPVTGRGRHAGAGRRRAGVVAVLPRVVGDPCERTLAYALPAELRRGRLAQRNRARMLEARDERRVHLGHHAHVRVRAALGGNTGGQRQVLDGDRDPMQRPKRVAANDRCLRLARRGARVVRREIRERIEPGLLGFDARQDGVDQLDRRDLARADQFGELARRRKAKLGRVHAYLLLECPLLVRTAGGDRARPRSGLIG